MSLKAIFSMNVRRQSFNNLRTVTTSRKMSCKRDLSNETEGDDCLSEYNYFFNPNLLKDKVAFITGGGSGIGFRITELFMRHGCSCVIGSRNFDRVAQAAQKLSKATNGTCIPVKMDVRNPEEVETALSTALSKLNKLDILVNCAAGNFLSPVDNLSYNAFKTVMEIDTMGTFNASKAAYKLYFKENGGNIINITATLHYKGQVMQCHAGSAKAAIDGMTKHMAVEWGGKKHVRVNGVAPGPIGGTVGMNKLGGKSEYAEEWKKRIPVPRWGLKTEIAESCLYLASDVSTYVNGHVLVVDGGEWLVNPNFIPKL